MATQGTKSLACVPSRVVWLGGVCLAPAPPGSWLSLRSSSFLVAPWPPLACRGVRDFAVVFSLPACVSCRGCFHFYSRKQQVPSALATARVRQPPGSCCHVKCFGGSDCSANHSPNCCHSGSWLYLGVARMTGMALVGRSCEGACLGQARLLGLGQGPHLLAAACPETQWWF